MKSVVCWVNLLKLYDFLKLPAKLFLLFWPLENILLVLIMCHLIRACKQPYALLEASSSEFFGGFTRFFPDYVMPAGYRSRGWGIIAATQDPWKVLDSIPWTSSDTDLFAFASLFFFSNCDEAAYTWRGNKNPLITTGGGRVLCIPT